MPREPSPRLLVSLVLSFVGLCDAGHARPTAGSQRPLCEPGLEYWSAERSGCWPCTRCAPQFTISPCAVYKDAVCGPLSALEFDWSFLATKKRPDDATPGAAGGGGGGQRRLKEVTSKVLWRFPGTDGARLEQQQELRQETTDFVEDDDDDGGPLSPVDEAGAEPESTFSRQITKRQHDSRERRKSSGEPDLPWDWQTGALVLAVCACIVFFLVAGCSALVYARQWRRMKRNFEPAGLEEISARLNYMVKAELAELVAGAPMNPGDPETRCQYLEKLLDRKRETPVVVGWPEVRGNLYIEEGDTLRSKRSQIARIHRNIETILSHNKAATHD